MIWIILDSNNSIIRINEKIKKDNLLNSKDERTLEIIEKFKVSDEVIKILQGTLNFYNENIKEINKLIK